MVTYRKRKRNAIHEIKEVAVGAAGATAILGIARAI